MIKIGDTTILVGDCREILKKLPDKSVDCCVTSPPYFGLRSYNMDDQIGLENTYQEYVKEMVDVFAEVHRVLKDEGTLWLNLGDSYSGSGMGSANYPESVIGTKQEGNKGSATVKGRGGMTYGLQRKNLLGIPWRVAFALQDFSYILRQDIIWAKPTSLPEPVKDRCVKSHEYIFLFSKQPKYHFDHKAIQEPCKYPGYLGILRSKTASDDSLVPQHTPTIARQKEAGVNSRTAGSDMRNKRSVWSVCPSQYSGAHFAVFPPELIRPCIKAGCPKGGTVLDPFAGSGTTGQVAIEEGCKSILIELNPDYVELIKQRVSQSFLEP